MSACNGPPVVRTLSGMVATAGEAEKEEVEDGKPKKVNELNKALGIMETQDKDKYLSSDPYFYMMQALQQIHQQTPVCAS